MAPDSRLFVGITRVVIPHRLKTFLQFADPTKKEVLRRHFWTGISIPDNLACHNPPPAARRELTIFAS